MGCTVYASTVSFGLETCAFCFNCLGNCDYSTYILTLGKRIWKVVWEAHFDTVQGTYSQTKCSLACKVAIFSYNICNIDRRLAPATCNDLGKIAGSLHYLEITYSKLLFQWWRMLPTFLWAIF